MMVTMIRVSCLDGIPGTPSLFSISEALCCIILHQTMRVVNVLSLSPSRRVQCLASREETVPFTTNASSVTISFTSATQTSHTGANPSACTTPIYWRDTSPSNASPGWQLVWLDKRTMAERCQEIWQTGWRASYIFSSFFLVCLFMLYMCMWWII